MGELPGRDIPPPVSSGGPPTTASAGTRRRGLARLELVLSGVCFGLMAVLARRASRGPGLFTAGHLSVVRFVVGAGATLLVFRLRPGTYRPRNFRLLVTRGVSGGVVVVLYFWALARIPAGEAGLLYNLFPVIATVMSLFTLGERPRVHLLLGLALATVGVGLALGTDARSVHLGWGAASALGAAVFAAASANVMRAMRSTENALTIFFFFCLVGLPVVAPFALDPWPSAPLAWGIALLMGLAAFSAQLLMTDAYGGLSVSEAAAWLQLTPIVQVLLAWPLLGERPTAAGLGGIVIAMAGVAWATVLGRRLPGTSTR
jgi:drug/metabolite transporter (DMT)-like permease